MHILSEIKLTSSCQECVSAQNAANYEGQFILLMETRQHISAHWINLIYLLVHAHIDICQLLNLTECEIEVSQVLY